MSKKVYDYLNTIQKDSNGKIAEFARNIVENPEQWITTLVHIVDGNVQDLQKFLGYEPRNYNSDDEFLLYFEADVNEGRKLTLLLLKNIADIVKNEKVALSTKHLKKLYDLLYFCCTGIDRVISDKSSKNQENYYINKSNLFEYLSRVMVIVDDIRIACAANEYDSMNVFEQSRESTFASLIDATSSLCNVEDGQIDLKEESKLPFNALDKEKKKQSELNEMISKYDHVINVVLDETSILPEDVKNKIIRASLTFRKHCSAEYAASSVVCDKISEIEENKTM